MLALALAAIVCISAGAVGSAALFDHLAAKYLWPKPENLVVQQASLAHADSIVVIVDEEKP